MYTCMHTYPVAYRDDVFKFFSNLWKLILAWSLCNFKIWSTANMFRSQLETDREALALSMEKFWKCKKKIKIRKWCSSSEIDFIKLIYCERNIKLRTKHINSSDIRLLRHQSGMMYAWMYVWMDLTYIHTYIIPDCCRTFHVKLLRIMTSNDANWN